MISTTRFITLEQLKELSNNPKISKIEIKPSLKLKDLKAKIFIKYKNYIQISTLKTCLKTYSLSSNIEQRHREKLGGYYAEVAGNNWLSKSSYCELLELLKPYSLTLPIDKNTLKVLESIEFLKKC
jgi:hypothetical protein